MEINQFIASKIKVLRSEQGLSQEKLALEAGIDRTYLHSIELGKRNVSVKTLYKVCLALEIKINLFFNDFNS